MNPVWSLGAQIVYGTCPSPILATCVPVKIARENWLSDACGFAT